MKKIKYIHEREVWMLDLKPTKGIEMQKIRPCLVLRVFNQRHFVIIPLTSQVKDETLFHRINNVHFLEKESLLCCSQIRVVDRMRFIRRLGKLTPYQFIGCRKKSAEVLQLLPRGPNGHNESEEKNSSSGS
jgi:mRNA interferase MazF